jgi:acyl-CoA thioesterase-1
MRHHHDRRAITMELLEQAHHRLTVRRVEVSRRLVGEQEQWRAGDSPRHGHALLLTAGELRRIVLHPMQHPDAVQCLLDAAPALIGRHVAVGERQLDVLVHGEIADQIERLKDEANLSIPHARSFRCREFRHRVPIERVLPVRRRVEQSQNGEQRRLAAPGRAGDRDVLPTSDVEMDA